MLTATKLATFIDRRNSSIHNSNLQFQIDAEECGFRIADLGPCTEIESGVYHWSTPWGRLVEDHGQLFLED